VVEKGVSTWERRDQDEERKIRRSTRDTGGTETPATEEGERRVLHKFDILTGAFENLIGGEGGK